MTLTELLLDIDASSVPPYDHRVEEVKEDLKARGIVVFAGWMVGSTYICGAGEDLDVLVRVDDLNCAIELLPDYDREGEDGEYPEDDHWVSLRKDNLNLLLTDSHDLYMKWLTAAEVCKYLHQRQGTPYSPKDERIAVHRIIMDGDTTENVL